MCPCSLGFLGCLALIVGGFYLDSCPGCGLKLAMAGLLVVMLGRPVCGVLVLMGLYRADAPFPMFRGGAVRLLSSLVAV